MSARAAVAPIVLTALLLVATAGGSSPAAHPDLEPYSLDLLASAHPTSAEPTVSDAAFDRVQARGREIETDTAAVTSATCDGCAGEGTALHVVYVPRARQARLDNVANAWTQDCQGCTGTALSVQVVVLRGRPALVANNRALSLTAACTSCRTSALAFQVVLVADRARPLSAEAVAELQGWFDEQAAALRASVIGPEPEPTPVPETTSPDPTTLPSPSPTGSGDGAATPGPQPSEPRLARRARRDAVSALGVLEQLLAADLAAEVVSADVDVSR